MCTIDTVIVYKSVYDFWMSTIYTVTVYKSVYDFWMSTIYTVIVSMCFFFPDKPNLKNV